MRIGLLTDGGHPYATGESGLWCERLVSGLADHGFDIHALSRGPRRRQCLVVLPPRVRTAACPGELRRPVEAHGEEVGALVTDAERRAGLYRTLRSETVVRVLESACRAPGARRGVRDGTASDLPAFAAELERASRPLSADRYDAEDGDSGDPAREPVGAGAAVGAGGRDV
ncbi:DUF3492 domain-containing protein [Streptomyces sp. NBC_01497]|uniref:DUF3492 domain-containing protein n=1 Tax=Streptomyces sp. NBC_01497 TaxID=2903885 RepID=UPI002E309ADB|nr:DUF3492 domain-containing protein [Streptomyces sp. NBC_01497]